MAAPGLDSYRYWGRYGWVMIGAKDAQDALNEAGNKLLQSTLNVHHLISDGFLNHQIHMRPEAQPLLFGLKHAV